MPEYRFDSRSPSVRKMAGHLDNIWEAFRADNLARICEMDEEDFPSAFGLDVVQVQQRAPQDWYAFKDNGSRILAVAHLDTVSDPEGRAARFVDTEGGLVIFSRALDDRLGAYIILDMLPALGINVDVLLTTGEESGQSTAAFFETPEGKEYDWMIEFDRGGTDVVMYQYDDTEVRDLVRDSGAKVGDGIFSDISYMGHLGIKGFNWGVGYQDYHGPRSHAFLDDTFKMLGHFLNFHEVNADVHMPHYADKFDSWGSGGGWGRISRWYDDDDHTFEGEGEVCDICTEAPSHYNHWVDPTEFHRENDSERPAVLTEAKWLDPDAPDIPEQEVVTDPTNAEVTAWLEREEQVRVTS